MEVLAISGAPEEDDDSGRADGIYLENPLVSGRRVNFGQKTRGPTDTLHFFWISLAPAFGP